MKNRKGFTLIELIAVIVILGLVLLIAVPFFSGSLKTFREDYYTNLNGNMRTAGQDFFSDNRAFLPHNYLKSQVIDLNTLEDQKYIDEVKDYNGDKCDSRESYIITVKLSKEEYTYASCLKCPSDEYDGTTQSEYCDPAWRDDTGLGYTDVAFTAADDVHVYIGTSRSDLKKLVVAYPKVRRCKGKPGDPCTLESGNLLKEVTGAGEDGIQPIYPVNLDTVDTNKVGVYIVEYKYNEETPSVYGKVYVYENKAPTISIKKTNKVLTAGVDTVTSATHTVNPTYDDTNPDDWAQELNFTFTYKFGSDATPGLKVTSYQYRINNRWEDYCTNIKSDGSCTKTEKREMNEDVPFRMVDSEGHISIITRNYTLKVDNTKPKCEVYETGTMGDNDWYVSDVSVRFRSKSDQPQKSLLFTGARSPVSGESYSGITTSTILKNTINYQKVDTNKVRWYGYIEDKANNYGTCYVEFKRDATAPVCTLKTPEPDGDDNWHKRAIVKVEFDKVTDNDKGQSDYSKVRDYGFNTWNSNTKVINHTDDTNGITYTGQIRDQAGNMSTCSISFKKDSTPPVCTAKIPAPDGDEDNGKKWHKMGTVKVEINVHTDNANGQTQYSGVRDYGINAWNSGTKLVNHTADTNGITYTYQIRDKAGNMSTCSTWFKKDSTNPVCELTIPGVNGDNGWHRMGIVTVKFSKNTDNDKGQSDYSGVRDYGIGSWNSGTKQVSHTTDTASQTYTGYIRDKAGNSSSCSVWFKKDSTPPTCTAKIPAPDGWEDGGSKWHKMSTVKVEINTTSDNPGTGEAYSGVRDYGLVTWNSGNKSYTHTTDTAGITYTYQIRDNAGNMNTCSVWFKKDSTQPTCTLKIPAADGWEDGGKKWHKMASVRVSLDKQNDNLSGVKSIGINGQPAGATYVDHTTDTAGITYVATVYDKAGNSNTCDIWFKKDSTAPTCTAKVPTPDGLKDGDTKWHKMSTVKVEINTTGDNLSGVNDYGLNSYNSGKKSYDHTDDTTGVTYTYQITDKAGNYNTCSVSFKKDSTKPTCSVTTSGTSGTNGWYKRTNKDTAGTVSGSFTSHKDSTSGVLDYGFNKYDGDKTISTATSTSDGKFTGYIRDKAGNDNSCETTYKFDNANPTCVSGGGSTWTNQKVTLTGTCSDTGTSNCVTNITKDYNDEINSSTETPGNVCDGAGNCITCPANQTVQIDKTKPTCSISNHGDLKCDEQGSYKSGIVKYSYAIGHEFANVAATNSWTKTVTITTKGTYTLLVVDNAGNQSDAVTGVYYSVTYDGNGGTTNAVNTVKRDVEYADLTYTATRAGYSFEGWNTSSSATTGLSSVKVNSDITLYAAWKICPGGTYNTGNKTTCTSCPDGYKNGGEGLTAESQCAKSVSCGNYVGTATGGTTQCSAGSYSEAHTVTYGNTSSCTSASAGYYVKNAGSCSQTKCGCGSYTSTTGQSSCTSCSTGHYASGEGNTYCSACPAGSHQASRGKCSCDDCDAGTYTDTAGQANCKDCDKGTYKTVHNRYGCTKCPGGYWCTKVQKNPCDAGYSSIDYSDSYQDCYKCTEGYANPTAGGTCNLCAAGTYNSGTGNTTCSACPAGYYCTGGANKTACPAGTYRSSTGGKSSSDCTACEAGKYSDAGASSCTSCPAGTYNTTTGNSSCTTCPAGYYCAGGSSKTGCPAGKYRSTTGGKGSGGCSSCSAGSYSSGTGNSSCTSCSAGHYASGTGNTSCSACAAGSYASGTGNSSCTKCSAGHYASGTGNTSCSSCAKGSYASGTGNSSCTSCGSGKTTSGTGSTSSSSCVSSGGGCFLAGTKVVTKNGLVDIDKIKIGDYVLSYNLETKQNEYKEVSYVFTFENKLEDLYTLDIDGIELKVTSHHRFYLANKEGFKDNSNYKVDKEVYVEASSLKVGDILRDDKGVLHRINKTSYITEANTVYNLQINDNHNYYVGENNILVHNMQWRSFANVAADK